jgi:hypothetical protein
MRTTIDIPDPLFRRAKAAAAIEGTTLRTFVVDAITRRLEQQAGARPTRRRVRLPLVPSRRPGSLNLSAEAVANALSTEDQDAIARS